MKVLTNKKSVLGLIVISIIIITSGYVLNLSFIVSGMIVGVIIGVFVILDKKAKGKTKSEQKLQDQYTDVKTKEMTEREQKLRIEYTDAKEKQQAQYTDAKEKLQAQYTDAKEKQETMYTDAKAKGMTEQEQKLRVEYVDTKEKLQAEYTDAKEKLQAQYTDAKEKQQAQYTEAKEELEKLKEIAKDEFSAMVTHELKTPLAPIIGYCKMLKTSMLGKLSQEQYEAIEVIEKNAKRLETLITDIMDVRKLDLDKLKFKIDDLLLNDFFSEIYHSYEPIMNQKGHKIVIDISDNRMMIKTDKTRLRQIFDNLINNALKAMPKNNGLINIGFKKENGNIVFHVKDNGSGIPLSRKNEIFKKFYQVDTSARRKTTGSGLGLAISKGLTEGLGGRIWFESDGKLGTDFYMEFSL